MVHWVVFILPCPALQLILMGDIALIPAHLLMFTIGMKYVLVKVIISIKNVLSVSIRTFSFSSDRTRTN